MEAVLILTVEGLKCKMRLFESMSKQVLKQVMRLKMLIVFLIKDSAVTREKFSCSVFCMCIIIGMMQGKQFGLNQFLFSLRSILMVDLNIQASG